MQPPSKRGRPREADPQKISRVALRLFERRSFDGVTMDQIAAAASVSRRTLFRFFPSKADLVWDGLAEARDTVKLSAASLVGDGLRLRTLVDELFVPVLRGLDAPEAAAIARRRLRLVARSPALLNHQTLHETEALIAKALSTRALPAGSSPALVARALVAVTFAALLWWAEHGEAMTALEATRRALHAVALAHDG